MPRKKPPEPAGRLTLKGKLRFNAVQKAGDYNVAGTADAALDSTGHGGYAAVL
jgi:hypothetical protein